MQLTFELRGHWLGALVWVATGISWASSAAAFNSEEHKVVVDVAMRTIEVDPRIELEAPTHVHDDGTIAEDRAVYRAAKQFAVGFGSNDVNAYDEGETGVQDNSYWTGYAQRGYADAPYDGNLWLWIPDAPYLAGRRLAIAADTLGGTFTLGQLVAFYGDYRKTTYCNVGTCFLTNANISTMRFDQGQDFFPLGFRPVPMPAKTYLAHISSGLWPPYGQLGNTTGNTAEDTEYDEAGWWGDEMLRNAGINDWHFSTAALAWYVGMHRLALRYVELAVDNPAYWNAALHYEANALHSYTDLFAFGHVVTHRDETSYGIVEDEGHVSLQSYQWMQNVFVQGGAQRGARNRIEFGQLPVELPLIEEPPNARRDLILAYASNTSWSTRALWEKAYHSAFNEAGACMRNLNGDAFFVYGDGRLRHMRDGPDRESHANHCGFEVEAGIYAIADGVRASVQSLFDAYLELSDGQATVEELAAPGSAYFSSLRHLPVYVMTNSNDVFYVTNPVTGGSVNIGANHFTGRWAQYAGAAASIAGAEVLPDDWQGCRIERLDGGSDYPPSERPRCQRFPLFVAPLSVGVETGEEVRFSAVGGSDAERYPEPPGYVWSFEENASGATIDDASGVYVSGTQGGVTDVVLVTDANGAVARASIDVEARDSTPELDAGVPARDAGVVRSDAGAGNTLSPDDAASPDPNAPSNVDEDAAAVHDAGAATPPSDDDATDDDETDAGASGADVSGADARDARATDADETSASGCGCSVPGSRRSGGHTLALLGLVALCALFRRRSGPDPRLEPRHDP